MSLSMETGPLKEQLRLNYVIRLFPNTTGNCLFKREEVTDIPTVTLGKGHFGTQQADGYLQDKE